MSLLRINSRGGGFDLHGSAQNPSAALAFAARRGAAAAPVVFMVHGYKFVPAHPRHCPHSHIFGTQASHPCWKAQSWPRALGLLEAGNPALGVAFGWSARGSLGAAYVQAEQAGGDLAQAVRAVRRAAPDRPIHILTHSLGARVAFAAMAALEAGDLARVIMLTAAEFTGAARRAAATPCGKAAEMIHVTSAENNLYDHLLRWGLRAQAALDAPLRLGLDADAPRNLAQVSLERPDILSRLRGLGYPIAPPPRRVCHWSIYLRDGVWPFYRALIERPDSLPLGLLRGLGRDGARIAPAAPPARAVPNCPAPAAQPLAM